MAFQAITARRQPRAHPARSLQGAPRGCGHRAMARPPPTPCLPRRGCRTPRRKKKRKKRKSERREREKERKRERERCPMAATTSQAAVQGKLPRLPAAAAAAATHLARVTVLGGNKESSLVPKKLFKKQWGGPALMTHRGPGGRARRGGPGGGLRLHARCLAARRGRAGTVNTRY